MRSSPSSHQRSRRWPMHTHPDAPIVRQVPNCTARMWCMCTHKQVYPYEPPVVVRMQGGAYLTLLNTIANMGVILPKAPSFFLIDVLTRTTCTPADPDDTLLAAGGLASLACPSKPRELTHPSPCVDAGGKCLLLHDGYYTVCWSSIVLGTLLGLVYMRALPKLMALPLSAWRANKAGQKEPEHKE